MSATIRDNSFRSGWRMGVALALLLASSFLPGAPTSPGSRTLPETAAAAPAGTALFQAFDLDRDGGQWQQTGTLLARRPAQCPGALGSAVLEEGAKKGDFTEADLDALMGGELALVVTPLAVERPWSIMRNASSMVMTLRDPDGGCLDEPLGVTAVLLPGDPDAAWDYVERQVADLAAKLDVPVEDLAREAASCSGSRCPIRASA